MMYPAWMINTSELKVHPFISSIITTNAGIHDRIVFIILEHSVTAHITDFHLQQCVSHDFSLSLHALSQPFLSLLHSDGQLPQPTGSKRGKWFHSAEFWVKWCLITQSVSYSTHFSCYVRTCSWCICSFARSYTIQLQHRQMVLYFPEMRARVTVFSC